MKFFSFLMATVSLACCIILAPPENATAEEAALHWVSKIVSIQGEAYVRRTGGDNWQPAALNDLFYPGDALQLAANSRAALLLSNESLLRVDQHTTLVFTGIEQPKTFLMELLEGAAYLFSRKARSLKVATPFVNGVVEGTEFYVQLDADKATIILYEGAVQAENSFGEVTMAKGQAIVAERGRGPRLQIVARPRDAVQWALYYPPTLSFRAGDFPMQGPDHWTTRLHHAMLFFEKGELPRAFAAIDGLDDTVGDPRFFTFRAGLNLAVGRVVAAGRDVDRALALDPNDSRAMALRAVMAVVHNRKEEALMDARLAVELDPDAAAARVALSYAQQARFDLTAALASARAATASEPENGIAWARLAELFLSTGNLDQALAAARQAAALSPRSAHARTVLGYAYLTQIKMAKARESFDQAIVLDSAAPLPRLGLGLAAIRQGRLHEGRTDIEIAVGLDPDNALLRSYLGKAYFDEKRNGLDERQLEMAKQLDPNDPTPWFYDAIRKQTLNRPGEALQDMQKAIELNDHRAVYRSRLMLDEDLAARSASLGRIYDDLSFEALALRQGARSLEVDPANYSAHRLLADMYASRSRHEIARVSELLQSQLLQPLNLTPVQPQLAESNLQILEEAGPGKLSFNEYNPLFTHDRISVQGDAVIGEKATRGGDLAVAGLFKWFSYSVGLFHYETDGFRPNNDQDQDIYNAYAQAALTANQSLQLEFRKKDYTNGDLGMRFDPESYSDNLRYNGDEKTARIGYHLSIKPDHTFLASLIYSAKDVRRNQRTILGYIGPMPIEWVENTNSRADAYSGELQYLLKKERFNAIIGAGYTDQDLGGASKLDLVVGTPVDDQPPTEIDGEIRHGNAYMYWQAALRKAMDITVGLSSDQLDGYGIEQKQLNPKLGFGWSITPSMRFRSAAFRTLTRSWASNQTLEPTQVSGFNQLFSDRTGTDAWRYCGGLDYQLNARVSIGGEMTFRDLRVPRVGASGEVIEDAIDEQIHSLYVYYIPFQSLSISVEYFYEDYSIDTGGVDLGTPSTLNTQQGPVTISYFHPLGWFLKLKGRFVHQNIEEFEVDGSTSTATEDFCTLDGVLGYRLPGRYGVLSLSVTNLFDKSFRYYDLILPMGSERSLVVQPFRQVLLKATISF